MAIQVPQRATLSREMLVGFAAKRTADELVNLVEMSTVLDLRTDGDAYMIAATTDYTPAILAKHAAERLTELVSIGVLAPQDRACFEILVLPASKGDAKKGIGPDPGAIAITRERPSEYRLAGAAAVKAHAALMDGAVKVASTVLPAYRRAIAEANTLERFADVHETVETGS